MIQIKRAHAALGAAVILGVLAVVFVMPALAKIPAADGTIHGCYLTATGALRVVDTAQHQTCDTSTEKKLSWPSTKLPDAYEGTSQNGVSLTSANGLEKVTHVSLPAGTYAVNLWFQGGAGICELVTVNGVLGVQGNTGNVVFESGWVVVLKDAGDIAIDCSNPGATPETYTGAITAVPVNLHLTIADG